MPKNLLLFSDGTGNSSGKLFKTNVWRLYEAVDLADPQDPEQPRQFAYYDDGVGTSSFKPLAVLGGAFGVGLARNVLDLYVFLCRMYEPGDHIYAFGFSRGAFTIRVLVSLVMTRGLLLYHGNESELQRLSRDAFRAYRRELCKSFNPLVGWLRNLRDAWLNAWNSLCGRTSYRDAERIGQPGAANEIKIDFVGLWDTVDAYGLPVDELTRAIDAVIWPLTMRDYNLNRRVLRARHALAIDDERNTFHPRLWNEQPAAGDPRIGVPGGNLATRHIDEECISQVWFAGVHSNVGGGYPDDSLSYVPLQWIMREANKYGLRFQKRIWDEQIALSDENGPIYDSRHGLGGYYRYNPRRIEQLTHTSGVRIGRTKVHESVLRRIQVGHDGYAPITLPPGFAVMKVDGNIVEGDSYLRAMPRGPVVGQPKGGRAALLSAMQACAARARSPLARAIWRGAAALVARVAPAAPSDAILTTGAAATSAPAAMSTGVAAVGGTMAATSRAPLVGPGPPYAAQQEHVYNWVWRRRIAYFATLTVTLALAVMPLIAPGTGACAGALCFLATPIAALGLVLPSFATTWTDSFLSHPDVFLPLLVALIVGLQRGGSLEQRIRDEMRRVWYALPTLKPSSATRVPASAAPGAVEGGIERLRNHPAYRATFRALTHGMLPTGFLVALGFGALALYSQLEFAARSSMGGVCRADSAEQAHAASTGGQTLFDPRSPCTPTGVRVVKGATYRVRITVPAKLRWHDASIPAGPNGFECRLAPLTAVRMAGAIPLRRHLTEPWFRPMARIGATGNDTYPLHGMPQTAPPRDRCNLEQPPSPSPEGCSKDALPASSADEVFESFIVARSSGDLFLYVNDAVETPFANGWFYKNNGGCGRIEVSTVVPS